MLIRLLEKVSMMVHLGVIKNVPILMLEVWVIYVMTELY